MNTLTDQFQAETTPTTLYPRNQGAGQMADKFYRVKGKIVSHGMAKELIRMDGK